MLQQKMSFLAKNKWIYVSLTTLVLAVILLVGQSPAIGNLLGGSEPLAPEVAFVPDVSQTTSNTLTVRFKIEEGYYLYRDKTSFKVESLLPVSTLASIITDSNMQLGEPTYPEALVLEDDFFGEMSIFRDEASIDIPYTLASVATGGTLAVKYQGCADIGLCYPPTTVNIPFTLDITAAASVSAAQSTMSNAPELFPTQQESSGLSSPASSLQSTTNIFGDISAQDELLPPELAYLPQILREQLDFIAR